MAEEQPLKQRLITCQHCYEKIYKVPGADWWRGAREGQVVCDPMALFVMHKPMPRI
jgi:hypothetical protein